MNLAKRNGTGRQIITLYIRRIPVFTFEDGLLVVFSPLRHLSWGPVVCPLNESLRNIHHQYYPWRQLYNHFTQPIYKYV